MKYIRNNTSRSWKFPVVSLRAAAAATAVAAVVAKQGDDGIGKHLRPHIPQLQFMIDLVWIVSKSTRL